MKYIYSTLLACLVAFGVSAQCSDLFISGYVEGYANNRALELYNPTNAPIDLGQYSVGRFSNGGTTIENITLPSGRMLMPYDVYVIVLDKTDTTQSGFEEPVWNGYNLLDTLFDSVTGLPVLDDDGNVVIAPQYDSNGSAYFGSPTYNADYDLLGRADTLACPVYSLNNALYFNGNDAVALVFGATVAADGSNIIDVIGVIGEDPGQSWEDNTGGFVTRDRTLKRKFNIQQGTGVVAAALGDTLAYSDWDINPKNTFNVIGSHDCVCDVTSTSSVNQIPFAVYPNPTSGEAVMIESETSFERVVIYSALGQQVSAERFSPTSFKQVDISQLPTGIYLVETWFDNDQRSIEKLIVR